MPPFPRYPWSGYRLGSCRCVGSKDLHSSWTRSLSGSPSGWLVASLVLSLILTSACSRDAGKTETYDLPTLTRWLVEAGELVRRQDRASGLEAERLCLQVVEGAQALEAPLWEARASQQLGRIYRKVLEKPRQAILHYERAAALYDELGETGDRAAVLNSLGAILQDLGEIDRAMDVWEGALPLARQLGDRGLEAGILNSQAIAARRLGEVQRALTLYDRVVEAQEALDRPEDLAQALHNRGRLYQTAGQYPQALTDLGRAQALVRDLEEPRARSRILTRIGQVRERQGDLEGALEALEEALALREETEQERGRAVTLLALGQVYEGLGRPQDALERVREALDISRRKEARGQVARALTALGRLDAAVGHTEAALVSLREALTLTRELRDPVGEVETAFALARTERARGELLAALQHGAEALDTLEALRGRAATHDLRRAFLATHRDPYDFQIDLLMELHRSEPEAGHDRRALEIAERSRAQSLVELLTGSPERLRAGADPELLAHERTLEQRLTSLERLRLDGGAGEAGQAGQVHLEARLDATLRELRAIRGQIFTESPRYESLTRPPRRRIREIQAALDTDTLLLEYHLGAERSFLWAVTSESVTSFELPARDEIETTARTVHELLQESHYRRLRGATGVALERLGRQVLAPVASFLAGQRLAVAADGALHYVPFATLPLPGAAAPETPLVAGHEVVHVPSASALLALREQRALRPPRQVPGGARGLIAVIADPIFDTDDPRLPEVAEASAADASASEASASEPPAETRRLGRLRFSGVEADAILRLAGERAHHEAGAPAGSFRALGFEATREAATDPELARYRFVHLSTHGRIDTERPELSQLVFARFDPQGRSRNASLLAHEVYDLDLPVDLVVLSACETALGKEVRGEGLVGLSQGFLSAGAAAVLVSLWRVDDRATAALMERFYRRLLAGASPAAALREAQDALRRETDWEAPYYWAGFVLQGDWRTPGR